MYEQIYDYLPRGFTEMWGEIFMYSEQIEVVDGLSRNKSPKVFEIYDFYEWLNIQNISPNYVHSWTKFF